VSDHLNVPLPEDYREFLRRYGCAAVGAYHAFGLGYAPALHGYGNVAAVTEGYRAEEWPGTERWVVISEDGFGNPIGIAPDGRVWIPDHDGRGTPKRGGWNWTDERHPGITEPIRQSFSSFLSHALRPFR